MLKTNVIKIKMIFKWKTVESKFLKIPTLVKLIKNSSLVTDFNIGMQNIQIDKFLA